MATRASRKRQRVNYKEKSDHESGSDGESSYDESSESEEEEYIAPPQRKRQRTNPNKVTAKDTKDTDEKDQDEDEGVGHSDDADEDEVDTENTNTSNRNRSVSLVAYKALEKENKKLKQEIAKLKKENEKLRGNKKSANTTDIKKILTRLSKALVRVAKLKKTRFTGWESDITVEQPMDKDEFDAIFKDKGRKIQPLPDYKPKSVKTIIEFDTWSEIKALFDAHHVELPRKIQVSLWKQGSFFSGKGYYRGSGHANIDSLQVEHNRSQQKLKLVFTASQCEDNESVEVMVMNMRQRGFNIVMR